VVCPKPQVLRFIENISIQHNVGVICNLTSA
jgi:hypothetical protein